MSEILFIAGIDTDAGKTYATGWLARHLMDEGHRVITQKFIQTGCAPGYSEDIEVHRRMMGTGYLDEDFQNLTKPVIYKFPASAQLAARLEGKEVDAAEALSALEELGRRGYDYVLSELAGGVLVPVTEQETTADIVARSGHSVALVTNSRLGSINHTLMSIEALQRRRIPIKMILYNHYFDGQTKPEIVADTREYLVRHYPEIPIVDIPAMEN